MTRFDQFRKSLKIWQVLALAAALCLFAGLGSVAVLGWSLIGRKPAVASASSRPGEMTLAAYKAQQPPRPVWVRCRCRLLPPKPDRPDYCVHVTEMLREAVATVDALAAKASPEGKRAWELLKDGEHHTLTVKLYYDQSPGNLIIQAIDP